MITLETDRLVIRNFVTGDWEALLTMIVQYETTPYAAFDGKWPTAPDKIKDVIHWFATVDGFLAVCLKDTGRFIGFVATNPEGDKDKREYNLGYVFDSRYHHQGYATEACRAVLRYAFDHLTLASFNTGTAAENRASCRLLERLGFTKTGEGNRSLQNKPDGTPIMFFGYSYELTREQWDSIGSQG